MVMTPEELKRMVFPGESGGDYNALFGYSNRPGRQFEGVNVTDMTVDQALQFAAPSGAYGQFVKSTRPDPEMGVATPLGAWQVVGKTLAAAKQGLGLKGTERMTPALQDQIGMWIYENQGPGAWQGWGKSGGGSGSRSSGSGTMPMGLFDMQEEPQTFGQRLREGVRSGGLVDALALAANSLRMNPDPNIATMVQARQERRGEERTNNRTAQWLASQGRDDLAQALMTGALDAKTAVATALQKPNAVNGVEVGGKLVNPETGEVIYDPTGGAEPVLSPDQLSGLNTLRDDATQATKELSMIRDAWNSINTFYQNPGSVSDRALVIAFAKVLDPTSVVRESESAAIANSGSLSAGLRSTLLNTLQGGGNLPDDIRDEILNLSREMYGQKLPSVQQQIQLLQDTAARAGLPPELVFSGDLTAPAQLPAPTSTVRPPSSFIPAGPPGRI
jgi:hypothetical protein